MNTLKTKSVLLALAASAALSAFPLMADSSGGIRVYTADLNLADPADAAVAYKRIVKAVRTMCANLPSAGLSATDECRQRTIDHTVAQVASPQLTAVHLNQAQRVAQSVR